KTLTHYIYTLSLHDALPIYQSFTYSKRFVETDQYEISLSNDASKNRDRITYQVNVVKDQRPSISVNTYSDTVLYKRVVLGGMIGDRKSTRLNSSHVKISYAV